MRLAIFTAMSLFLLTQTVLADQTVDQRCKNIINAVMSHFVMGTFDNSTGEKIPSSFIDSSGGQPVNVEYTTLFNKDKSIKLIYRDLDDVPNHSLEVFKGDSKEFELAIPKDCSISSIRTFKKGKTDVVADNPKPRCKNFKSADIRALCPYLDPFFSKEGSKADPIDGMADNPK